MAHAHSPCSCLIYWAWFAIAWWTYGIIFVVSCLIQVCWAQVNKICLFAESSGSSCCIVAWDVPYKMAKDIYCSFSCERVLKYGISILFSFYMQLKIQWLYFVLIRIDVVKMSYSRLVLYYISPGSYRYPPFAWTKLDCLQRRLWHFWEDQGGAAKKSTEGIWY